MSLTCSSSADTFSQGFAACSGAQADDIALINNLDCRLKLVLATTFTTPSGYDASKGLCGGADGTDTAQVSVLCDACGQVGFTTTYQKPKSLTIDCNKLNGASAGQPTNAELQAIFASDEYKALTSDITGSKDSRQLTIKNCLNLEAYPTLDTTAETSSNDNTGTPAHGPVSRVDYANNTKVTSLSGDLPGSDTTSTGCTAENSAFIAKMDDGNIQCDSRSADWEKLATCQSTLTGYDLTCCNDVLNKATDATVTCDGDKSKVSGCGPGFFKDTSAGNDVCTECKDINNKAADASVTCSSALNSQLVGECGANFFKVAGATADTCQDCAAACTSTQFESTACVGTDDRVCTDCAPACNSTQFESTACVGTDDRACSSCAPACISTQYESTACGGTANRVCTACQVQASATCADASCAGESCDDGNAQTSNDQCNAQSQCVGQTAVEPSPSPSSGSTPEPSPSPSPSSGSTPEPSPSPSPSPGSTPVACADAYPSSDPATLKISATCQMSYSAAADCSDSNCTEIAKSQCVGALGYFMKCDDGEISIYNTSTCNYSATSEFQIAATTAVKVDTCYSFGGDEVSPGSSSAAVVAASFAVALLTMF